MTIERSSALILRPPSGVAWGDAALYLVLFIFCTYTVI
jgi:hypothetical protein